jgi:hypothetical protein
MVNKQHDVQHDQRMVKKYKQERNTVEMLPRYDSPSINVGTGLYKYEYVRVHFITHELVLPNISEHNFTITP